jgi:hypothetical protein
MAKNNAYRPGWAVAALIAAALLTGPSSAQENIGGAMVVVNKVEGSLLTGKVKVIQGDAVFRDEGVTTDANSSAKLILKDDTNLTLGPNSSVKLDRFIYSGAGQPGTIVIHLAKGAFRLSTGNADKTSYEITTPTAAIGVRGTEFFVSVTPTQTHVHVDKGNVNACVIDHWREYGGPYCLDIGAGQMGNVTSTSASIDNSATDPNKQTYDAMCQGGLCSITSFDQFASNNTNNQIGSIGAGPNSGGGDSGGGTGGAAGASYGAAGGGGGGGSGGSTGGAGGGTNGGTIGSVGGGSGGGGGGNGGGSTNSGLGFLPTGTTSSGGSTINITTNMTPSQP